MLHILLIFLGFLASFGSCTYSCINTSAVVPQNYFCHQYYSSVKLSLCIENVFFAPTIAATLVSTASTSYDKDHFIRLINDTCLTGGGTLKTPVSLSKLCQVVSHLMADFCVPSECATMPSGSSMPVQLLSPCCGTCECYYDQFCDGGNPTVGCASSHCATSHCFGGCYTLQDDWGGGSEVQQTTPSPNDYNTQNLLSGFDSTVPVYLTRAYFYASAVSWSLVALSAAFSGCYRQWKGKESITQHMELVEST